MGKVELVDPENVWNAFSNPYFEELKSIFKVLDINTKIFSNL